jgi:hypothetical protein
MPGLEWGAGELDDELIVVTFSPLERESAVYYGGDHADVLEDGWESVVDAMTSDLRASDYEGAVNAAMLRLRSEAASSSSDRSGGVGGSDFPIGWVLVLVGIAAAFATYEAFKRGNGDYAGEDEDWFGGSSSRRRSFRSWSSSGSRRSSGGGSRSSSRSSERAGGGSKKW